MKMGIRWVRSRKTGEEGILETDKVGRMWIRNRKRVEAI